MVDSQLPSYCYRVNASDEVVWVDSAWLAFAKENGAPELADVSMRNQCLWQHMADEGTRSFYEQVHKRVRSTGKPLMLPVRCDSPNLKRHMQLTISPEATGTLHYESILLRVEAQPHLALIDMRCKRTAERMTMCSCCQKILIEPTGWIEIEDVATALHLFESKSAPNLFYSVCPDCAQAAVSISS